MPDIRVDSLGFTKATDIVKQNGKLQRSRTYAGSSIYVNPIASKESLLQRSQRGIGSRYDENYGVEEGFSNISSYSRRGSGLHPRVLHEEENKSIGRGTRLSVGSDYEKSMYLKSAMTNLNAPAVTYSSNLNTIQDELNVETIVPECTSKFPDAKLKKHSQYVNVETKPSEIKLLDNDAPLDLSPLANTFVPHASPFFQTREFDPNVPTDTGILLKILNYEFDLIPDEVDSDEEEIFNEDLEANYKRTNSKRRNAWYEGWIDLKCIKEFLNSYKNLSVEEYKEKYPWDQFYDPELYYSPKPHNISDSGLNLDMIDSRSLNTVPGISTATKREHSYLLQRKGF